MPALVRALVAAAVLLVLVSGPASAEERMWIGFHDDPVLRYGDDRQAELDAVRAANATIVRTLVEWRTIAPKRPRSATNSFDAAYRFADLDEFVRNAQQRGMEVLMTIWGTPTWANGGKGPAYLPKQMRDFQNFTRALASRYSGSRPGYPFVRFYGIWNESNLGNFLAPQFNAKGKIVSPRAYAKLAAAGYAGIKAGSPRALVAIGVTSANGKDKRKAGATDSTTPGTFARLLAQANKRLKFDAWAQHPYPVPVSQGPGQRVRYPNVAFSTLSRFDRDLDKWFGRKNIPI
ncbi:MAG: cellulase family glycosylhydrolase, partial [Thermoleophilia bacterium]|nr:cellulase family glycosylhydrolase [Thermoleophilia bacterium]